MVETNDILRDFVRWCPRCHAQVQIEKECIGGLVTLLCRRCKSVIEEDDRV